MTRLTLGLLCLSLAASTVGARTKQPELSDDSDVSCVVLPSDVARPQPTDSIGVTTFLDLPDGNKVLCLYRKNDTVRKPAPKPIPKRDYPTICVGGVKYYAVHIYSTQTIVPVWSTGTRHLKRNGKNLYNLVGESC